MLYSSVSGSLIQMYDNSTTQIQDVEVGDIVKSYLPVGMPDEFYFEGSVIEILKNYSLVRN